MPYTEAHENTIHSVLNIPRFLGNNTSQYTIPKLNTTHYIISTCPDKAASHHIYIWQFTFSIANAQIQFFLAKVLNRIFQQRFHST